MTTVKMPASVAEKTASGNKNPCTMKMRIELRFTWQHCEGEVNIYRAHTSGLFCSGDSEARCAPVCCVLSFVFLIQSGPSCGRPSPPCGVGHS